MPIGRASSSRLSCPVQGRLPRPHEFRSALLPRLVRRAAPARSWPGARIWRCTSGGCRRSAGSSPRRSPRRFSVTAGFYRTCVIDGVLEHSPAEHVRRPPVPAESPTLGFTHLQFEALLTAARGKGGKVVLVPLPPAAGRAIDRAIGTRTRRRDPAQQPRNAHGPSCRHPATPPARGGCRRADLPAASAHAQTYIRHDHARRRGRPARRADRRPPRRPSNHHAFTTEPATTSTATPTTSSPPTWHRAPDQVLASRTQPPGARLCRIAGVGLSAYLCADWLLVHDSPKSVLFLR
jgi:integrase/recombinase XerD